jgi:hypothetical protein
MELENRSPSGAQPAALPEHCTDTLSAECMPVKRRPHQTELKTVQTDHITWLIEPSMASPYKYEIGQVLLCRHARFDKQIFDVTVCSDIAAPSEVEQFLFAFFVA